ncbi:DNA polymerase III subunit delta [Clostridium tyrobutyricum]|uniref:DNA polymerase III subunit delta n=1 Tax=Clostridium tyrobutyricum TaxID=1519 RepID=UPI0011CC5CF0|nr:DNA polymerase III subunit delta [Clostridium tyrobutyricum]
MENKFIIYSKTEFKIRNFLNDLKKCINELNISEIDINAILSPQEIIEKCETLPFVGNKRLIIIKADFLYDDYKDTLKINKALKSYIKNVPYFTILVLYLYQRDKREKISKRIKALQKEGISLITDDKDTDRQKYLFVNRFCKENNIKLEKNVYNFILNNASNLDLLNNDFNKLKFMDKITIETVKKVFCSVSEEDLLDFLNEIGKNRKVNAIQILKNLLDGGSQAIALIRSISKQYQKLIYCKSGLLQNKIPDYISKKYGLNPYYCSKLCDMSKQYTLQNLAYNLEICLELDNKILNQAGVDANTEIELLVLKLK